MTPEEFKGRCDHCGGLTMQVDLIGKPCISVAPGGGGPCGGEFQPIEEESTSTEVTKWADKAMFEAAPMQRDEDGQVTPKVYLISATPDPLGAIAAACRMYEGHPTYDMASITDEQRRHYWEQVQKTHLKAPLEFVDLHFFIEGVTRSFTHQMVRQRTAVYAQESLRFAVKEGFADDVPYPPSLMGVRNSESKEQREIWDQAVAAAEAGYSLLVAKGVPAEDARGLLPHSVTTRLNYKTNLRNLLDHAGNRLCTQAQFEWRMVFAGIVKALGEHGAMRPAVKGGVKVAMPDGPEGPHYYRVDDFESTLWQYELIANSNVFKPICFELGKCPFMADFDRQCTIRERVNEGKFDEILTEEWLMDPTAGRRD